MLLVNVNDSTLQPEAKSSSKANPSPEATLVPNAPPLSTTTPLAKFELEPGHAFEFAPKKALPVSQPTIFGTQSDSALPSEDRVRAASGGFAKAGNETAAPVPDEPSSSFEDGVAEMERQLGMDEPSEENDGKDVAME